MPYLAVRFECSNLTIFSAVVVAMVQVSVLGRLRVWEIELSVVLFRDGFCCARFCKMVVDRSVDERDRIFRNDVSL